MMILGMFIGAVFGLMFGIFLGAEVVDEKNKELKYLRQELAKQAQHTEKEWYEL